MDSKNFLEFTEQNIRQKKISRAKAKSTGPIKNLWPHTNHNQDANPNQNAPASSKAQIRTKRTSMLDAASKFIKVTKSQKLY